MRLVIQSLLVILIMSMATFTLAADPEPQKPADPPARHDGQITPNVDINQAEIEAGVAPDAAADLKSMPGQTAASPMITEIRAVLETSRQQVADLAAQGAAHPGHEADVALQKEISQLKKQAELDILAIQARYARTEGKEDLAQQIDAAIAAIISPPAPAAPTEVRPAPDTQR